MKAAVHVTFSANYIEGRDSLYTYLLEKDDIINIKPEKIVIVQTPDGLKKAQVKDMDWQFTEEKEARLVSRFGPLKYAYSSMEVAEKFNEPKTTTKHARL